MQRLLMSPSRWLLIITTLFTQFINANAPSCTIAAGTPSLADCHYIILNQMQRDDFRLRAFAPEAPASPLNPWGRLPQPIAPRPPQILMRERHGNCEVTVGLFAPVIGVSAASSTAHEYTTMASLAGAASEITASCVDQLPVRGGTIRAGQNNRLWVRIGATRPRSPSPAPQQVATAPCRLRKPDGACRNEPPAQRQRTGDVAPSTPNAPGTSGAEAGAGVGPGPGSDTAAAATAAQAAGIAEANLAAGPSDTVNYCDFSTGQGCTQGFSCVQAPVPMQNAGPLFGSREVNAAVCLLSMLADPYPESGPPP
ncbi:MAG: hypothetical protein M1827_005773 [Pycnora praestabilis]|nr:MAG: hypothetical protein M1827_005773 [Pycnora praestabilis]